jgi:hypothetical protein
VKPSDIHCAICGQPCVCINGDEDHPNGWYCFKCEAFTSVGTTKGVSGPKPIDWPEYLELKD